MEQRLKNLEDLCEMITKEVVEQNKNMIEINNNLIKEIKCLREVYVKQDEDFEEFKNLLRKIYELNRQQPFANLIPAPPPPPPAGASNAGIMMPGQLPPSSLPPFPNSSYAVDQINQSMMNNLSFQSEKTPLNMNQPNLFNNINTTSSSSILNANLNNTNYSIPSSASALSKQQQSQIQPGGSFNDLNKNQPIPFMPGGVVAPKTSLPPFNPSQPPPSMFQLDKTKPQQPQVPIPPQAAVSQPQQPLKFAPPTSTPQNSNHFSFAKMAPSQPAVSQQQQQPQVISTQDKPKFDFSPTKPVLSDVLNKQDSQSVSKSATNAPTTVPKIQTPTSLSKSPIVNNSATNNIPFAGINLFKPASANSSTPTNQSSGFSFGNLGSSAPLQGSLFKAPQPTTLASLINDNKKNDETQDENDEHGGANPEEYEAQVDFKPIVQLKEVEVKTGEEEEEVLFKQRCKLFRFDNETKEWKEKGVGDIKFLKHKQTGVIRILMRRESILKLCANHRVQPDMKLNEMSPKQYSWMAIDFSENEAKSELLLAKFRAPEEASQFKSEFEKSVKAMAEWNKTDKSQTDNKPAEKPASEPAKPAQQPFGGFGSAPIAQQQPAQNKPFSFGLPTQATNQQPALNTPPSQQTQKFDFGSTTPDLSKQPPFGQAKPADSKPVLFDKKSLPSFGDLAAQKPSPGSIFSNIESNASASPIFKPIGFGGGIQTSSQPVKPLFGTAQTPKGGEEGEDNDDQGGANPEEYEPQVDFTPIVKLKEVEVKTGEEEEEPVFKQRCKLYRYDGDTKEWKEKGTGEIKVLKHKEKVMYRILMRRDQILKLCANHRVTSDLKLEIFNEKQVRWHAHDYSESEGKYEYLAVRFKHEDDAKKFKEEVEKAQLALATMPSPQPSATPAKKEEPEKTKDSCAGLKPSLSEMFKKSDTWTCDGCYVTNPNDKNKCAACSSLKPGAVAEPEPPKSLFGNIGNTTTNTNGPKISFGISTGTPAAPISFGQPNTPKFDFGSKTPAFGSAPNTTIDSNKTPQPTDSKPSLFNFGSSTKTVFGTPSSVFPAFGTAPSQSNQTPTTTAPTIENIFGGKSGLSFQDLAGNQKAGFSGGFGSTTTGFQNPPVQLFGIKPTATTNEDDHDEGGDNQNPEEYEPQIDFKPLVKLQEVEVKTGEEDEDIIFKQRCKLYRFSTETKEWKEKGTGEIKILKHKTKENTYRILMRRDQVLKLCANHRITSELKLESMNEKQLRWMANDCSEPDGPHPEFLAVKFRSEDDATTFKNEFEKAQKLSANAPKSSNTTSTQINNNPNPTQNSLSSLLKTQSGNWSCEACYTQNKPDSTKCAACETPKPSANNKNKNDVIVIGSVVATSEQVQKAREFKLPDNFYLYSNKPECPGCQGCEKEE